MCSIMGFCGKTITHSEFKECFDRTISRGPDASKIIDTGCGYLGFHRLAIMDLHMEGMQPFALDGDFIVCNGEIYEFRPLKEELQREGYTFISNSDCEILLPMYRKYGLSMFEKLDSEFALPINSKTASNK